MSARTIDVILNRNRRSVLRQVTTYFIYLFINKYLTDDNSRLISVNSDITLANEVHNCRVESEGT